MPRPVSTEEITERSRSIGRIEIERFGTHPSLLKAYAALLEAVTKLGGHADQRYSNVELFIPKTAKELAEQLESDQRRWDSAEALWLRAVCADGTTFCANGNATSSWPGARPKASPTRSTPSPLATRTSQPSAATSASSAKPPVPRLGSPVASTPRERGRAPPFFASGCPPCGRAESLRHNRINPFSRPPSSPSGEPVTARAGAA